MTYAYAQKMIRAMAVIAGLWGVAEAATIKQSLTVDLYEVGATTQKAVGVEIPLTIRPTSGTAIVTLTGWDLDEKAEGSLQLGTCDPVTFPDERIIANDSQVGSVSVSVPAICIGDAVPRETFQANFERLRTNGYRLSGITIEIPDQPSPAAPRLSLLGQLQNAGVIPAGFVPSEIRAVKTKVGTRLITTLCMTSTRNETHAVSYWRSQAIAWLDGGPPAIPRVGDRTVCGW